MHLLCKRDYTFSGTLIITQRVTNLYIKFPVLCIQVLDIIRNSFHCQKRCTKTLHRICTSEQFQRALAGLCLWPPDSLFWTACTSPNTQHICCFRLLLPLALVSEEGCLICYATVLRLLQTCILT